MCCDDSTPAPPNYSAVAEASVDQAKMQQQTASDQLSWSKDQWAQQWPTTQRYMNSMVNNSDQQTANAQTDRQRYESIYQPEENQLATTAQQWNNPVRSDQEAGAAMADVANTFDAQRKSALSTLEGYGVDPSMTRFGALDLGTRVSQAAATAAAGTQSRKNTEATGLGLLGESINIGKGYPGQVSQSYAGATSAGQAGISSGLNTSTTYGNMMGNPATWSGLGNNALGSAGSTLNTGYGNDINAAKVNNDAQANDMKGIGSMVGAAAMMAMM